MSRLVVGPFNRVEGDLEVRLEVADGRVASAQVVSPMYRGFEQILVGRPAMDALVVVPRICGICSVSQSVAAARALADAAGVVPPANGVHATNLMLGTENAADHLTHFYLFFMPDYTRPAYAARPWFAEVSARFAALSGTQSRRAIAARQRWFELLGTLGGKWPHTQSIQPGGSSRAIDAAERLRLLARIREFRAFLEAELFAAPLEDVLALRDLAALDRWLGGRARRGDFALWLEAAADTGAWSLGPGPGRLIGYGGFARPDGGHAFPGGVWSDGRVAPLDLGAVTEDATHAWLADAGGPRHPSRGLTQPDADKPAGYSWNKAPRLAGRVVETGALARQLLAGQPLVADAVARHGATVGTRVLARLVELATIPLLMERELAAIVPREPFHVTTRLPDGEADGVGLTEAARGALGHWIRLDGGRIASWQIVAPTSWNFSPRDADGVPGALEAALVGVPVAPGETTPVAVQHVVRSFDPCMVCTVH